ncbi:hypothetical protein S7711_09454 [Stachybotrys chartarum IBT 7711]|uniref:Xylanolytic transcriptional activator regulatory domain-containing protein n=1 Tax=Stachybotrys chartarum (strain CBS 109288 / IBT 7711) TaxID=1280523 RepID=A0A084B8S9_STACB|nr:hypothetical protein S7711_09454 [Stachybotrys chartarum IBT 7711]
MWFEGTPEAAHSSLGYVFYNAAHGVSGMSGLSCVRLGKECDYSDSMPTDNIISPHEERLPYASQSPRTAETLLPRIGFRDHVQGSKSPFPPEFFLDQDHLSPLMTNALAPSSQSSVRRIASEYLESDGLAVCERYFTSFHTWLPVISKKRIMHELREPDTERDSCHELLLLCMKLCTTTPGNQPAESDLYILTRSLCSSVESAGFVCLQLIQCLVLLTAFELSHAIYPAAYLTIGRAARLGLLTGLCRQQSQPLFNPAETWTLREEQRRTWWAVFVLERFIHIEPSCLPFATPEPGVDELLPLNDDDWDNGGIVPSEALYTKAFSSITNVGLFARLCQAAHMLSMVIQHKRAKKHTRDVSGTLEEAKGLHYALSALQSSIEETSPDFEAVSGLRPAAQGAFAVCVCARYLLYSLYACNENQDTIAAEPSVLGTEMQGLSLAGIKAIASSAAPKILRATPECPLLTHCLYLTATECAWFLQEDHELEMRNAFRQVVQGLECIGKQWAIGREFAPKLDILCPVLG